MNSSTRNSFFKHPFQIQSGQYVLRQYPLPFANNGPSSFQRRNNFHYESSFLFIFNIFKGIAFYCIFVYFALSFHHQLNKTQIFYEYEPSNRFESTALSLCAPLKELFLLSDLTLPSKNDCCSFCPLKKCLNNLTPDNHVNVSQGVSQLFKQFVSRLMINLNMQSSLDAPKLDHNQHQSYFLFNSYCYLIWLGYSPGHLKLNVDYRNLGKLQTIPLYAYIHSEFRLFSNPNRFLYVGPGYNTKTSLLFARHLFHDYQNQLTLPSLFTKEKKRHPMVKKFNFCQRSCYWNAQSRSVQKSFLFQQDMNRFLYSEKSLDNLYNTSTSKCKKCSSFKFNNRWWSELSTPKPLSFFFLKGISLTSVKEGNNFNFFLIIQEDLMTEISVLHNNFKWNMYFYYWLNLLSVLIGFNCLTIRHGLHWIQSYVFCNIILKKNHHHGRQSNRSKNSLRPIRNRQNANVPFYLQAKQISILSKVKRFTLIVMTFLFFFFFLNQAAKVIQIWLNKEMAINIIRYDSQKLKKISINICFDKDHPLSLQKIRNELYFVNQCFNHSRLLQEEINEINLGSIQNSFHRNNIHDQTLKNSFLSNPRVFFVKGHFCIHFIVDFNLPDLQPFKSMQFLSFRFWQNFKYFLLGLNEEFEELFGTHMLENLMMKEQTLFRQLKITMPPESGRCIQYSLSKSINFSRNFTLFFDELEEKQLWYRLYVEKKELHFNNCRNRQHCLYTCIQLKFFKMFKKTSSLLPFVPFVGPKCTFQEISDERLLFHSIREKCLANFYLPDCERSFLIPTDSTGHSMSDQELSFNLRTSILHIQYYAVLDVWQVILQLINLFGNFYESQLKLVVCSASN